MHFDPAERECIVSHMKTYIHSKPDVTPLSHPQPAITSVVLNNLVIRRWSVNAWVNGKRKETGCPPTLRLQVRILRVLIVTVLCKYYYHYCNFSLNFIQMGPCSCTFSKGTGRGVCVDGMRGWARTDSWEPREQKQNIHIAIRHQWQPMALGYRRIWEGINDPISSSLLLCEAAAVPDRVKWQVVEDPSCGFSTSRQ